MKKKREPALYEMTEDRKLIYPYSRRLGMNLQNLRKRARITQKELSSQAGVPQTMISYMESGWANPSLVYMLRVAQFFKIPFADLFR